jgi:formylglycine-generating enzyme required for sulfatase activity
MAKKKVKKPATRPAKKPAPRTKAVNPKPSSPVASALPKPEIKKIQGLLKAKTADGVTLGLSLLESLGATAADYEAVFTETVIKSVLNGWVAESWESVAKALVPHGAVSDVFQRLAEEKYLKRPKQFVNFNGLAKARIPAAKAMFVNTWVKWLESTGSIEDAFDAGTVTSSRQFIDCKTIPIGSFQMGLGPWDDGDTESYISCESYDSGNDLVYLGELETSTVDVHITIPFSIGQTVVTQGQWRAVMGTEPWRYGSLEVQLHEDQCNDDYPAVGVTWHDAVLFCKTLTDLAREVGLLTDAQMYRLPSEAEWEYACRAGASTKYSFGDDKTDLDAYGWYNGNSSGRLQLVAQKTPNAWQLFDMHGNVSEWCYDVYASTLTGGEDPVGPVARQPSDYRVCRGGSYEHSEAYARCGWRDGFHPAQSHSSLGFRVVRTE